MPGRDRESFGADPLGRANYAAGSQNLDARAALWSYAVHPAGADPARPDWFLDLVTWHGVRRAADVGCGSGRYVGSLRARVDHVVAIDLSPAMLAEVAALGAADTLVNADVGRLPLRDGCLDAALAAWMLYHATDPAEACSELRRVVVPGGVLIAVTNAAAHTAELDELYGEATAALLGGSRPRPALPANGFTLDEAADHLSRTFAGVTAHPRRVRLRVPSAEPVVAYLGSLRSYVDQALQADGATFDDLVPFVVEACERRIHAVGAVEVTGLPVAFVCR